MTTVPYIKIWTTDLTCQYPLVKPAKIKRKFLDETLNSHGYICQPMTTANLHGWDFLLPHDVEATWDGISDTTKDHVDITKGKTLENGYTLADSSTGNATISFNLGGAVETDPDHYVLLIGPPNVFIDGAKPMAAVIRSDFYHHNNLQFCWKMTTPNKPVLFPAGTPFVRMMNYPKALLKETDFIITPTTAERQELMGLYNSDRQKFYQDNPGRFPQLYKRGVTGTGEDAMKVMDDYLRPTPANPRIEISNEQ
jgi:hypothetical protein